MGHRDRSQTISATSGWFSVTWIFGDKRRTFAPNWWICLLVAGVLPLLGAWYLAATLYLVFHDQMLASLISHQTDVQYAYEDQIAELRTQLDRETSRGLMDRQTLNTTVRDLTERSLRLESRAAAVDRLVARDTKLAGGPKTSSAALQNPLLAPDRDAGLPASVRAYAGQDAGPRDGDTLRLKTYPENGETGLVPTPRGEQHSELAAPAVDDPAQRRAITRVLASVEQLQEHTLGVLREPTMRSIAKYKTALLDTGLGSRLSQAPTHQIPADVGGPFVPLPNSDRAEDFDQNAAILGDAFDQAEKLDALVAKVPLRKPISGPLEVTSPFGARIDPFYGRAAMHTGIDFRESYGDGVRATAAGVVTIAGSDGGYGTMVEIDHGNGLSTRYAHLSSVSVVPNQKVAAGDLVGHAGSSGRATGPHLHYETRVNGEPVDPVRFLKAGAKLFEE
ncbi:MAG: M23 family metallopeptidase [Beijerinckiaceae bacterium]|nr:M23 family metallopeptidase [Beijerinckiaceae bacterium]